MGYLRVAKRVEVNKIKFLMRLQILPLRHVACVVLGLLSSTVLKAATPPVLQAPLVGSYQGMLQVPGLPEGTPFGKVEFTSTSAGKVTGKLLLIDKKSYPFTMSLTPNGGGTEATGTKVVLQKAATKTVPAQSLSLTLTVRDNGNFTAEGTSTLVTLPSTAFETLPAAAFKVVTFVPKKNDCPWIGTYTGAFSDALPSGATVPSGAGYVSGVVGTSGEMKVAGKLADGTTFTGSMKSSADARYFLLLTPYTVGIGYFGTSFQLTQRSDSRWHVADGDVAWTKWSKAANSKDKAFRAGFGPLDVFLTLMQWVPPAAKLSVADTLGIDATEVFSLGLENVMDVAKHAKWLPKKFGLNTNNTLRVAEGAAGSPGAFFPTEWAKFLTAKVDPKTGLVTLTIKNIEDTITPPFPAKPKIIKRTVSFYGVMFQLLAGDTSPIANGFGSVPPLVTTDPAVFGGFDFKDIITDPFIAGAAGTAGTYNVTLDMLDSPLALPDGAPADNTPTTFTISSDLRTLTLLGKTIPLVGDGRPGSLVFSDAKKTPLKNLTVTVFLNVTTGVANGFNANYFQASRPLPRQRSYVFVNNTLIKQP